jgi:hypothetical protein
MNEKRNIPRFSVYVLIVLSLLIVFAGRAALSEGFVPNWANIDHAPFNLVEPTDITNPVITADDVTDASASFVADPFLFHEDGKWYMFFEVFNTSNGRGEIGLATSTDGLYWNYDQIVLFESWHVVKLDSPPPLMDYIGTTIRLFSSRAGIYRIH